MPVSLSVKNVPDEIIERLRRQAKSNHRSVQGEILAILEENLTPKRLAVHELYEYVKGRGFETPDESVQIIRELRDSR